MKIEGPDKTREAGAAKKKDKAGSADGSFGGMLGAGDTAKAAPSAAPSSIAMVDVLLAVQGADDPAQRAARKRMVARADDILGILDNIRLSLLTGGLTVGQVIDIADVVASHREKVMDPKLTAILDEIDLRAQIEIAKMRMALDTAQAKKGLDN
ncbi:MAG: flagellar assembly protein FliX [Alphaproteobacteria bacterium]|nr:flagellar assembly protein FliX [Alphaproteobacteria bacterium]MBU0858640.1 flagellar assembly protein FliX [Alphaproteobacteria bacterium]